MNKITKITAALLCVWAYNAGLSAGDWFVPKPFRLSGLGNSSSSDAIVNLAMPDLFEYPDGLSTQANLDTVAGLRVDIAPKNEDIISLYKYEYYTYKKYQALYLYKHSKKAGYAEVDVKIAYKDSVIVNTLTFDMKSVVAADDSYDLPLTGEAYVAAVLSNDRFLLSEQKNTATLSVDRMPARGRARVIDGTPATIEYTPEAGVENYSVDSLRYTVTTETGATASASVRFSLHHNPFASRVIEFMPAPGQFTNEANARSDSGEKVLGNTGGTDMVSLGGFGGYIILGFDQPIVNRPENPYGVDFSIKGNSFAAGLYSVWTEPAAVQVMKDENGDGIPNDGEWYELAGSDYYLSTTKKNVEITYYNPHYNTRYTVPWRTNRNENGALLTNTFHQHAYYPDPFDFGCGRDSATYAGNCIKSSLDMSTPGNVNFYRVPVFGYSDNRGNSANMTDPQNPYFADDKGKAADGFDLGWAVDRRGNPVQLDTVHFVKIYTAGNANAGWLGEWSSEVLGVAITTPAPGHVPEDYYINYIGITQLKVLKGKTCQYEGFLFKNGRPVAEGTQHWRTSDATVGTVDNTGKFTAKENGETWIYFTQKEDVPTDSVKVAVVELTGVVLEMEGNTSASNDSTEVYAGETIYITAQGEDNIGDILEGKTSNRFAYERYDWTSSAPEVGTVSDGLFVASAPGRSLVRARSQSDPSLSDSIRVIVKEAPPVKPVQDPFTIPAGAPAGQLAASDLFTTGTGSVVYLETVDSNTKTAQASIVKNQLLYAFPEGEYGVDTLLFQLTSYGKKESIALPFVYGTDPGTDTKTIVFPESDSGNTAASLTVYPNPFAEYIVVEAEEDARAILCNASGGVVLSRDLKRGENRIETGRLPKGVYIVRCGKRVMKLVK